jgi:hypothetical protein
VSVERSAKLFCAPPSVIQSSKPSLSLCAMGAGAAHVVALALVLPVMITLPVPTETGSRLVAVRVALATAAPDPMDRAITTAEEPEGVSGEGDIDDPAWSAPKLSEVTGALPTIVEEAAPPRHAARPEPEALPEEAASPEAASPQGPALASPVAAAAAAAPPMAPLKTAALEEALELEEARIQNAPAPALAGDVALETIASLAPADFVEADEVEEAYETDAVDGTVPVPLRKPPKTTAAASASAAVNAVQAPRAIATPSPNRQVYERKPQPRGSVNQQQPVFKGILGGRRATTMQEYRTPGG